MDKLDAIKIIYPIFYEEILFRRRTEATTTYWVVSLFIIILGFSILHKNELYELDCHIKILIAITLLFLLAIPIYFLRNNRIRHQEMARVMTLANEYFGLFDHDYLEKSGDKLPFLPDGTEISKKYFEMNRNWKKWGSARQVDGVQAVLYFI